jgi:hypothetical protein
MRRTSTPAAGADSGLDSGRANKEAGAVMEPRESSGYIAIDIGALRFQERRTRGCLDVALVVVRWSEGEVGPLCKMCQKLKV